MSVTDKSPSHKQWDWRPDNDESVLPFTWKDTPFALRVLASAGQRFFRLRLFGRRSCIAGLQLSASLFDAAEALEKEKARGDVATAALLGAGFSPPSREQGSIWRAPEKPDPNWLTSLQTRPDRAERALTRAGWTYQDGAAEWRPPLGPDARPLINAVDNASSAVGLLQDALDVLGRHALGRGKTAAAKPVLFGIGDAVSKVGGDYVFNGEVRAVVVKRSGLVRFVVEDDRGVLHVFSEKQLAPCNGTRSA